LQEENKHKLVEILSTPSARKFWGVTDTKHWGICYFLTWHSAWIEHSWLVHIVILG